MRAAVYKSFGGPITIETVPDPTPPPGGVVIRVGATGLCRSDWHGWMGHDPSITLPHVPGHELAGTVAALGEGVTRWKVGDRVTLPFVCGCGRCPQCFAGNHQVCDNQFQPGFTHWGSFAEYVAIQRASMNLVALPDEIDDATAASLGCRFATSFRAVVDQGRASAGQWVAVHGCGGAGLSAIMIAIALGARVVAVDIASDKLALARDIGAAATLNAVDIPDIAREIREITDGGAHLSIDALGSPVTFYNSITCLRKRGRHVQVGLLLGDESRPVIPMDKVIANELEILGSHGMQAYRYDAMLAMIRAGTLSPQLLVGRIISLSDVSAALPVLTSFTGAGMTVVRMDKAS